MADPVPRGTDDAPLPGSAAWWRARTGEPPPSEPRRGRPPRSFERIIATAAELVDEVGTGEFNMRSLADRLNTSTATLYRHIPAGKEELMVYVVERLLGELLAAVDAADQRPRTWRHAAQRFAVEFQRVLSSHPNVLPLLVAQLPLGPNGLSIRERMIGTLTRFGFSRQLAARTLTTLLQYVLGSAVTQPASPEPDEAAAIADYYRTLDPEAFPHIVSAADALTAASHQDGFLAGLEIVLDGIDRARRRT